MCGVDGDGTERMGRVIIAKVRNGSLVGRAPAADHPSPSLLPPVPLPSLPSPTQAQGALQFLPPLPPHQRQCFMKGQRALHEAQRVQLSRQGDAAVLLGTIGADILETPVMGPRGRKEGVARLGRVVRSRRPGDPRHGRWGQGGGREEGGGRLGRVGR